MKNSLTILAATTLAVLSIFPAAAAELSPVGKWRAQDGSAQYQVSYCGGKKLCAKLTCLSAAARAEANSNLVNSYVVKGASQIASNKWSGTVLYDGDTYEGTLTLLSSDTMKLKGCSGIFCKSLALKRA